MNTSVDMIKCIQLFDVKYYGDVRQEINSEVRGLTNAYKYNKRKEKKINKDQNLTVSKAATSKGLV